MSAAVAARIAGRGASIALWTQGALGALALWLAFANYGIAGDLIGGDANVGWALAGEHLRELLGVFVDHPGLGFNAAVGMQAIPVLAIAAALHALGITTGIVARIMLALYFFIALTGARSLGRVLLRSEEPRVREAVALAGALLYAVNHYTVHVFGSVETYFPLGYIALPWMLAGIVEGCERDLRRGLLTVAFAIVCAGGVAMNPAFFGVALLVLPLGAMLELAAGVAWRRIACVAGGGLALGLGLCAWWALPAPSAFGAGLAQLAAEGTTAWTDWMSTRSSFAHVLRLDGYVGGGALPHADWYASPLGALAGYVPLLIALAGFGIVRRRFAAAALLTLAACAFLAKGTHAPFGGVYALLMDHVPGFTIFRSAYDKWAQLEALLLVVVYDAGFAGLLYRARAALRSTRSFLLAVAACALPVVVYPWPAYAGAMLQSADDPLVTFHATLPSDYRTVGAYLRAHAGGGRALILNAGSLPNPLYTWGYFGEDPLPNVAGVPVAGPDVVPRSPVLPAAVLVRALDALGVRYLVVHDDLRNPAPAADIGLLVARRDATLALRTQDLRVYERRGSRAALLAVERNAALIAPHAADESELAADPLETAQFVPNAAPALPGPAAVLLAAARPGAQPGDAALGSALVAENVQAPAAAGGAVLGNPFVAVPTAARCGARDALMLEAPSRWWVDGAALPAFTARFCLAHPRISLPFVDGVAADAGSAQVAFAPRPEHELQVLEAQRSVALAARALPDDGLTFAFTAPFSADALLIEVPPALVHASLFASLLASDAAELGTGYEAGGAAEFLIPLAQRKPLPGETCFVTLRASDRTLWPAIRALHSLRVVAAIRTTERFRFAADGATLAARSLPGTPPAALRERIAAGASPLALGGWSRSAGQEGGRWSATGGTIDARSAGTELDATASGRLIATDRYRLRVAYRASGDAALHVQVDGYTAERPVPLVADGGLHETVAIVHPPSGASGAYRIHVALRRGAISARIAFENAGPNALLYAASPRRLEGTLLSWQRRAPWWFEARVASCSPCVLRAAVSDPARWLVTGATVRGTYVSSGQSAGAPWSANVTGASTWVLDAGTGNATVTLLFWPALLAMLGCIFAVLAALAAWLVLRRARTGAQASPERFGRPFAKPVAIGRVVLVVAVVALALLGDAAWEGAQTASDALGFAVWCGVVALGVAALL